MGIHSRPLLLKNFSSFLFYIINLAIVFIGPYYFAIVGVIVFAFFFYPQWNSKFDMFYTATEENKKRIEKCPSIKLGHFYPTLWLGYGFLQAIFGGKSKYSNQKIHYQREIVRIPKDGYIALDWAEIDEEIKSPKKNYLVFILPGLTATCNEPYIINITEEALKNGYRVVIFNERHVGPNPTVSEEGYIRYEEDLKYSIDFVKEKYPDHKILAVGHSFGANILFKYLGVYNKSTPVVGAVSVANPFDLYLTSKYIKGTIYEGYVTHVRQVNLEKKKEFYAKHSEKYGFEIEKALSVNSAKEYDEYFSRRLYGYPTVDTYYREISCAPTLHNVNIPSLLIQSYDDPIINLNAIPVDECISNKKMILIITKTGGHVGWFENNFRPKRWFPVPVIEYLNCLVEEFDKK